MKIQFARMFNRRYVELMQQLSTESSKLKSMIFRTNIMKSDVDKYTVKYYISYINDFINAWSDYANQLATTMKSSSGSIGARTIPYDTIKDYVYATYDYASVLRFADELTKSIKNGNITDTDDIDEYFESIISKAFDNMPSSVSGLIDDANMGYDSLIPADKTAARMYDSVKSYSKLFENKDRIELYSACKRTVEFLVSEISIPNREDVYGMKLFISMINHIIDYITYSIIAYASRIFMISSYAYPFIENTRRIISESVDPHEITDIDSISIDIMRQADDVTYKDINNFDKLVHLGFDFLTMIGAESKSFENMKDSDFSCDRSNRFTDKLYANELISYIGKLFMCDLDEMRRRDGIQEFHQILHTLMYNTLQGIPTSTSSKQEILYVIKDIDDDRSLDSLRNLSKDLFLFSMDILFKISKSVDVGEKFYMTDKSRFQSLVTECYRMLNELYRDIAITVLNKFRDIEFKINNLNGASIQKTLDKIKIKLPTDTTSNISLSVPDTTPVPLSMYSESILTDMEMFDEYLRSVPMFANDIYLSEAFSLSALWNMLLSACSGWWKKAEAFYTNKKLLSAVKWVKDNKNTILNMDYSSISLQVLPYKKQISFPKGYENFENNLKSYKPTDMTSEEAVENFIKSLYPDENVYGWFKENEESGARKLKNYILYIDDISKVSDKAPQLVECKGNNVLASVRDWVEVIENNSTTFEQLRKIKDRVNNVMTEARDASVKATQNTSQNDVKTESGALYENDNQQSGNSSNQSQQQSSGSTNSNSSQQSSNNNQSNSQNNKNDASKSDDPSMNNNGKNDNNIDQFVNRAKDGMMLVFNRIFGFTLNVLREYELTTYKYLKDAYSQGRKE